MTRDEGIDTGAAPASGEPATPDAHTGTVTGAAGTGDDTQDAEARTDQGPSAGNDDAASERDGGDGPGSWVPWTVAALAVVLAVLAVVQWNALRADLARVDQGRQTAAAFVGTLTTWDAGDGLDDTYDELVALASPAFVEQVDTVFGDSERERAEETAAVSSGDVVEVLSSDDVDGSLRVVVLVDQTLTSSAQPEPVTARRTALVDLVAGGDGWLVDDLELLSELVEPVAPEAP